MFPVFDGLIGWEERIVIMKQKYTITVADMEMNIISDASREEVENIVGILDRRMREVNLHSPRCTKNEAAILCALSYCSERIAMQEAFKKVEKDAFRFAGENEKLRRTIEELQEEIDRLKKDAAVMRSILDHAAAAANAAEEARATAPRRAVSRAESAQEAPAPIPMGDQISAFDAVPEELAQTAAPAPAAQPTAPAAEPAVEEPSAKKTQKPASKTRVGTMFDLLTFSDV
ncbi:MAG: cell division protein ZapA [Ruminococcaceae bacterium]|nr:cell division protein ZapA [Oscillospiraceae bacterium]